MTSRRNATILSLALAGGLFAFSGNSFAADKDCTDQPRERWMSTEEIAGIFSEKGYDVRNAKVEGDCIAVYALKDGKKAEYFVDPVTGAVKDQEEK